MLRSDLPVKLTIPGFRYLNEILLYTIMQIRIDFLISL
jgi:hypothetical protein